MVCDNCGEENPSTLPRENGSSECAPCWLSSLDHGRMHVIDNDTPPFHVVIGFHGKRHVYTHVFEEMSESDAIAQADRCCGHVADRFVVQWSHVPDVRRTETD